MKIIQSSDKKFSAEFSELLQRGKMDMDGVSAIVSNLLKEIKNDGNNAVKSQVSKFDRWTPVNDEDLIISVDDMKKHMII